MSLYCTVESWVVRITRYLQKRDLYDPEFVSSETSHINALKHVNAHRPACFCLLSLKMAHGRPFLLHFINGAYNRVLRCKESTCRCNAETTCHVILCRGQCICSTTAREDHHHCSFCVCAVWQYPVFKYHCILQLPTDNLNFGSIFERVSCLNVKICFQRAFVSSTQICLKKQ